MDTPPIRCVDAVQRDAMTRRLHRRSIVMGQITPPAVPGMIDAYPSVCDSMIATAGRPFTPEQPAHVKSVLERQPAEAHIFDDYGRALGQQCYTTISTSQELGAAASGLRLQRYGLPREQCPIEMHWLVYQKPTW
jgi:hypothetical protein